MAKVGLLDQLGVGGSNRIPTFWPTLPKQKFALQLAINVMKHTLHKWGGNISSIHNVIGTPKKLPPDWAKKMEKVGPIPKRGGGVPVSQLF